MKHSQETKDRISTTLKAKGIHPSVLYADTMRGRSYEELYGEEKAQLLKSSRTISNLGRRFSDASKMKMRMAKLGQRRGPRTIEDRTKISQSLKGRVLSDATKAKLSLSHRALWKNPDYRMRYLNTMQSRHWNNPQYWKRLLARRIPSFLESRMIYLISKYQLPFRYVGDGQFWIGRMNPDFVSTDGSNLVIEVYGRFQKSRDFGDSMTYEHYRRSKLSRYGYRVVFLNDHHLFDRDWEDVCRKEIEHGSGVE